MKTKKAVKIELMLKKLNEIMDAKEQYIKEGNTRDIKQYDEEIDDLEDKIRDIKEIFYM